MRLKEIKPGMSVHCKNDDEKKALLEEAERLGYVWFEIKRKPTEDVGALLDTINFYDAGNGHFSAKYKHITQSGRTEGAIEFSDLIIPEMSAEEVLQICSEICNGGPCDECIIGEENCFAEPYSDKKKVIEICQKWKSNHEKKEPEIETVDICRIIEIQPGGRKRCVHELDLITDPELPDGIEMITVNDILRKYCMEHDGEFIAVHEVVSRVKR